MSLHPASAADEDLIPPEILKQMDPDILSGKRPTFATIKQQDIFGLRDTPRYPTDFVTFDFDPMKLSSVQTEIIKNWIAAGHNPVYLTASSPREQEREYADRFNLDSDLERYRSLMSPMKVIVVEKWKGIRTNEHKVCTDVGGVTLPYATSRFSARWMYGIANCPSESSVMWHINSHVDEDGVNRGNDTTPLALCGRFPIGDGHVFVGYSMKHKTTLSGTDTRRWELNYWHWALGLPVPGAANTNTLAAGSLSLAEAAKLDVISLKNDDVISGTIVTPKINFESSVGKFEFPVEKIEKISFEGSGSKVDTIALRTGDKLSGQIQNDAIKINLASGQTADIDRDKIREIRLRKR